MTSAVRRARRASASTFRTLLSRRTLLVTTVALLAAPGARAQRPSEAEAQAYADSMERVAANLKYQQGRIELQNGLATLDIPAGFRYLDREQTRIVLQDLWGNPGGDNTLGMLFPANLGPTDDGSWGVVITYDEDGYVKDDEAEKIDYAKLLKEMQSSTRQESKSRQKMGYPAIELVGWAAPPRYDKVAHKLYWAKHLKFTAEGQDHHSLNYNVRVLGRRGVLVLNAVGDIDQLVEVEQGMTEVMGFVAFNDGHRYADFRPGVDKVAAYGIGALVAGKVAAKAGLFKLLLSAIVAAKKLVIIAVIGLAALLKKVFSGRAEPKPQAAK